MKHVLRVLLYFAGLFLIAIGINLQIVSQLGVSPISAFTVPISQASGINLGTVTVVVYTGFVALQMALLGRKFRWKNLLQVPFSVVFGFFINSTGNVIRGWLTPEIYPAKLLLTVAGIFVCSFGATLYILMDVVPNPPEGLNLAFADRLRKDFGTVKIWSDCIFIALGVAISLLCMGRVTAIREGTVLSAVLTGQLINLF
ncbi:MAG: DUF6198 family protein, partial [Eubacteriales bacterium]|nr:DUF6198 family protein [Eubacteriales bacterium]